MQAPQNNDAQIKTDEYTETVRPVDVGALDERLF